MKTATKILLLTTALATVSGAAIAGRGFNCDGQGPLGYGPARMQQFDGKYGPGPGMRGGRGGNSIVYQLDNLSDEQKQQITEVRREAHEKMFNHREQARQNRAEMKQKIDAILTDEQRAQLRELRPWH